MSMLAAPCGNDPSWSKDVLRATLASAAAIISLLCDWVPSDGNAKPVSYWRVELPQTFLARLTGRGRNLAHLEPVIIACPAKAPQNQFTINVRYSKHCFTVAFDPRRHKPKWMIMDGKQARAFDEERFELSKLLAAMIAALPQADVNQTHERNYVYTIPTSRPDGRRYQMFFRIGRAKSGTPYDLELFVESAYLCPTADNKRLPYKIRFSVLAYKVSTGRPVRFQPR